MINFLDATYTGLTVLIVSAVCFVAGSAITYTIVTRTKLKVVDVVNLIIFTLWSLAFIKELTDPSYSVSLNLYIFASVVLGSLNPGVGKSIREALTSRKK